MSGPADKVACVRFHPVRHGTVHALISDLVSSRGCPAVRNAHLGTYFVLANKRVERALGRLCPDVPSHQIQGRATALQAISDVYDKVLAAWA